MRKTQHLQKILLKTRTVSLSILFIFSAMQAGYISPLTHDPAGIPHQVPIQEALEKSRKLESPTSITGQLKQNPLNEESEFYLEKSWENARKTQEKAKSSNRIYNNWLEKGWEYFKEISSLGLLHTKVDEVEELHREARKHYLTALWSSRQLYREIITDLHEQKHQLEKLGAHNYTGPAHQSHKRTEEILNRLNKTKIKEQRYSRQGEDILTIMTELSQEIRTAEKITPEIFNLINSHQASLATRYSDFREETQRKIQRMKNTHQKQRQKHLELTQKLENKLKELEKQEVQLVTSNPGRREQGEITHTEIAGTPRNQYKQSNLIKRDIENQARKAERIHQNKEHNYLSRSIKIYRKTTNQLESTLQELKELEKRLGQIEKHYKEKIDENKGKLEESLLTRYREEIKQKEEKAKNQRTKGETINQLKQTLEYIETVKELEEKDLAPIKQRIENTKNRVKKYIELGYPLQDKKEKLQELKQIQDPEMLPKTQKILNELKTTIKIRVTPLKQRINEEEKRASNHLRSVQQIKNTPYGEKTIQIDKNRLKDLENKYNRVKTFNPLEHPIKKLETYQDIIRQTSPIIKRFKPTLLSRHTEITTQKQETPVCNREKTTKIQVETHNPLSIPLHNVNIEKEVPGNIKLEQQPEKDKLHFNIRTIRPHETKQRTKKARFTPYTCTIENKSKLNINEERTTEQKEIKIRRNVKTPEVLLDLNLPPKTEFIHKPPNTEVKDDEIKVKTTEKEQTIKLTYTYPSNIKITEWKNQIQENKVKHTIEIINHEQKINNFTLTRDIDPEDVIHSTHPTNTPKAPENLDLEQGQLTQTLETMAPYQDTLEITVPGLEHREQVEIIYRAQEPKKESQEAMKKINFFKETRELTKELETRISRFQQLFNQGRYEETMNKAPGIINELKRQPTKQAQVEEDHELKNESEEGEEILNESLKETKDDQNQVIGDIQQYLPLLCSLKDCKGIKQEIEGLKTAQDLEEDQLQKLKQRFNSIKREMESSLENRTRELEKTFLLLGKAFERTVDFEVNEKYLPYTQKDLESLKHRKEQIKENEGSQLIRKNLDYLIENQDPDKIKNRIEREQQLLKDSKELLSQIEKSSVERLQRAKNQYEETQNQESLKYLEKAKNHHAEGEYLNSILSSRKTVEKTTSNGTEFPYKHLAGAVTIMGAVIYVLKKPSTDKEEEEEPTKLKRGK